MSRVPFIEPILSALNREYLIKDELANFGNSDPSSLPEVLARLVRELTQIRDGVVPAVALQPTPPERWEDEEFIYLEADLHGEAGHDIDICIHSCRVFIRMVQPPPGPMCPVDSATRERR
jgi:hypothetical protein